MTKKVLRPIIPTAPQEYDPVYVNQLARALEQLIAEVQSADINFQGIPGSGSANTLEVGDFFIGEANFIQTIVQSILLVKMVFMVALSLNMIKIDIVCL